MHCLLGAKTALFKFNFLWRGIEIMKCNSFREHNHVHNFQSSLMHRANLIRAVQILKQLMLIFLLSCKEAHVSSKGVGGWPFLRPAFHHVTWTGIFKFFLFHFRENISYDGFESHYEGGKMKRLLGCGHRGHTLWCAAHRCRSLRLLIRAWSHCAL